LGKKQLPRGAMKFPWGKAQVPCGEGHLAWENNVLSLERLKFLEKKYVPNIFVITTISCLFLYRLATYHWKGIEEGYNFAVGNTFVPQGTWLILGQLKPLLLGHMVAL
jgi:hypothetical protein